MHSEDAAGMANSVNPDLTALLEAVRRALGKRKNLVIIRDNFFHSA